MNHVKLFEDWKFGLNSINEGLIKVPTDILSTIWKLILIEYLSYMWKYTENKEIAEKLSTELKVEINKDFEKKNYVHDLNTELENLPDKIKNAWKLEFGYIKFVIDWDQSIWKDRPKVNASYEESNEKGLQGHLTINPRAFMELVSQKTNENEIRKVLQKAKFSIWHEATHLVQHNSLKWLNKNAVGKSRVVRDNPNSSKEDKRAEYLTSLVEFDPQIKTKIHIFSEKWGGDKENLRKNLACFVGAISIEGCKPDEFFIALKNKDIKRWKKAVKLFYLNYGLDPSTLLN